MFIVSIAHLPHFKCLTQPRNTFDIGIIGAPFDTAVSYRPGKWVRTPGSTALYLLHDSICR